MQRSRPYENRTARRVPAAEPDAERVGRHEQIGERELQRRGLLTEWLRLPSTVVVKRGTDLVRGPHVAGAAAAAIAPGAGTATGATRRRRSPSRRRTRPRSRAGRA